MRKFLILLLAAVLSLVAWAPASATLMMRLETPGQTPINIVDDGDGVIGYSGSYGSWLVNVVTGLGSGILGIEQLDLNSINYSSAASSLTMYLVETNLTTQQPGWSLDVGGTLDQGGTALFEAYLDTSNAGFGGTLLADLSFSSTPFSGSGAISVDPSMFGGVYALTIKAQIMQSSAGVSSFDASLAPVPEPATMFLLGSGLAGMAAFGRRKFFKKG